MDKYQSFQEPEFCRRGEAHIKKIWSSVNATISMPTNALLVLVFPNKKADELQQEHIYYKSNKCRKYCSKMENTELS